MAVTEAAAVMLKIDKKVRAGRFAARPAGHRKARAWTLTLHLLAQWPDMQKPMRRRRVRGKIRDKEIRVG
jgi:hypothetical protein